MCICPATVLNYDGLFEQGKKEVEVNYLLFCVRKLLLSSSLVCCTGLVTHWISNLRIQQSLIWFLFFYFYCSDNSIVTALTYNGVSCCNNYVIWIISWIRTKIRKKFGYLIWQNFQRWCRSYEWLCWLTLQLFLRCPCLAFCLENRKLLFFWEQYLSSFLSCLFLPRCLPVFSHAVPIKMAGN